MRMNSASGIRGAAWLLAAVFTGTGCSQLFPPDSKQEARQRWSSVRAKLKYQLASESLAAGQLTEAQRHLDEALALNPEYGEAFVLQARILLEKGETASASEALEEGLRHGADSAETDYLSGIICQRYRKKEEALAWYQRAAQREPMNAPYVVAVAETLVSLDRRAEALELVRSRLIDFEQNATLRGLAGEIYMMGNDYEQAAMAFREAVRIAPDDLRLKSQLGMALTLAKKYDEARPMLLAATAVPEPQVSLLAALGKCHLALREPEAAKAVLRRAVDSEPGNARHWALLAQASLESRDLLTARRAAMQATQLAPDNREYQLTLGYVCWAQKDYRAGIPVLEPLARSVSADEVENYLLARCYSAVGSPERARECVEAALQANPDCAWARHWTQEPEPPRRPGPSRRRAQGG